MFTRSSRVLSILLVLVTSTVVGAVGSTVSSTQATPSSPAAAPAADVHLETVRNRPAGDLTAFDGDLYFTSGDPVHGVEIWRSDGTEAGTSLLKDVRRGRPNSHPTGLTATRKHLFFFARGRQDRTDLWKTDGTPSGTEMVKRDVKIDTYDVESIGIGGLLYYFAFNGDQGLALWRSDGTARGTFAVMNGVKLGWPQPKFSDDDADDEMVAVGGRLLFAAGGDRSGVELRVSDGTRRGTRLVRDILPGRRQGSRPSSLTALGNRLFFEANDGEHGGELWRSDGTRAGTVMVGDRTPDGDPDAGPRDLTSVGGNLLYVDGGLWSSDGTAGGTTFVADISPDALVAAGDTVFFESRAGGHWEVWTSDGTTDGTTELTDLHEHCVSPGECGSPYRPTAVGDALFFTVLTSDEFQRLTSRELWMSDGTRAGTGLVDAFSTVHTYYPEAVYELTDVDGTVYLTAQDGASIAQLMKVVAGPADQPTCHGFPATITGGGQITGTSRTDVIVGSAGPDMIDGAGGNDVICGAGGDDAIEQGSAADGADSVDGGDGNDTIDYSQRTSSVRVTLSDFEHANDGASGSGEEFESELDATTSIENVVGGTGDDILTGSDEANRLVGGGGRDTFVGSFGDDVELGGPGDDTFLPDWRIDGGDVLDGGAGADSVTFGNRSISVFVTIDAGVGDDGYAGEGDTVVDIEVVAGSEGADVIIGGPDDERLTGDHGDDQLTGGGGTDILVGYYGDDHLDLEDGVDGNDNGDGGPGTDTATFDPGDLLIGVP